jgi:hypothetical protein
MPVTPADADRARGRDQKLIPILAVSGLASGFLASHRDGGDESLEHNFKF